MNMKRVVYTCQWLTAEIESLECVLDSMIKAGEITELEANRRFHWFIFQSAKSILIDSINKNMPLPNWRGKES